VKVIETSPGADIVQCGKGDRKALRKNGLANEPTIQARKLLISLTLRSWLAALDDFRNWLIREAA
jgi:hypothetical protein